MIVVLMGVSGSGKTFIGQHLAARVGGTFADGDDFHSPANKAKMAAGHALTDADRQPWLETLHQLLQGWSAAGTRGVLACSALKQAYRETLSAGLPAGAMHFVWLDASKEIIADRLAHRHHEYMNPKLLESQMQTLEPPQDALRVVNDKDAETVVTEILTSLQRAS